MTADEIASAPREPRVVETVPLQVQPSASGKSSQSGDLASNTMAVFFMFGLTAAALWIVHPFVPAIVWATMIVVALWPLMLKLQAVLGGRRWAAVSLMTFALLLLLVIPLSLAVMTIVAHTDNVSTWALSLREVKVPKAPDWVEQLPVAGPRVAARWNEIAIAAPEDIVKRVEPYVRALAAWLILKLGGAGLLIIQFLLTVLIAAILFARGEVAAAGTLGFFRRLAGVHGERVVILAGSAIRSVALGVVLTALIQSALGGIGFAVAGVPFTALLTAIMFMLAIAQIGPTPVLIGAVIWMYWTSDSAWVPTALLVWCLFVGAIDNVLRPILIQRSGGGELPLLIVLAGVVGGLLAFGLIGIFIGPVVLAVVYTLLKAWVGNEAHNEPVGGVQPSA
jgi:predicted PurR-regulated permease PerM